jgi:hypothetical protein
MNRKAQSTGLQLTRRLRAELLGIDGVTPALLDAAWPSIQFIGERVRQEPGALLADWNAVVRAAELRRADVAAGVHKVATDEIAAGMLIRMFCEVVGFDESATAKAGEFVSKLANEAASVERQARKSAASHRQRRGRAAEVRFHERLLITELELYWVREHGKAPATSEHSSFVKLAALLGGELGLDVTRAKVRTALGDIGPRKNRVMQTSKGRIKRG